jgi:hypothetical protein
LRLAVANHQGAPVLVALAAMAFDVIVGFGLKRFDQHPPRSRPRDFVQQQKLLTRFPIILLLDYIQHRWRPPSNPAPTGVSRLLTRKGTPPFSCVHQIHNFR